MATAGEGQTAADCTAPRVHVGKGQGKGMRKGRRSSDDDSSTSDDDTSSSSCSSDGSAPESPGAACVTPAWTRRVRQSESDWSAYQDDFSDSSSDF